MPLLNQTGSHFPCLSLSIIGTGIGYFLDEDNPADLVQNFFLLGSQYLYPVSQRPWIVFTFLFAKLSSSQQFS